MRYELEIKLHDIIIIHCQNRKRRTLQYIDTKQRMKRFQNKQETSSSSCDLNIIVEEKEYGAHWRILREQSRFFDELYRRKKAKDGTKTDVHLQKVGSNLVGQFLKYVYTNCSKDVGHFQIELNEINEVLKFGILFGLKEIEMGKTANLGLERHLDRLRKARGISKLHSNILKFLYVKTTRHKTGDIATYVAHKSYTAANMECLFEVLKTVSCSLEKIAIFIYMLRYITRNSKFMSRKFFTGNTIKEVTFIERLSNSQNVICSRYRCLIVYELIFRIFDLGNRLFSKIGLVNKTANPRTTFAKANCFRHNSMKMDKNKKKETPYTTATASNFTKTLVKNERQTTRIQGSNFVNEKVQNTFLQSNNAKQLCFKHAKGITKRSPANRRISLIKEHLERINAKFVCTKGQDATEGNVAGSSVIKKDHVDETLMNAQDRKSEQEAGSITKTVCKLWTTDVCNILPIMDSENDETKPCLYKEVFKTNQKTAACKKNPKFFLNELLTKSTNDIENNECIVQQTVQEGKPSSHSEPDLTTTNSSSDKVCSEMIQKRIYITGGIQKNNYFSHKAILELDLKTGSYMTCGEMWTGRYNHGIAQLENEIYFVGGNSGFLEQLRSVESYSPAHESWTTKPSMREARDEFSLVVCGECLYAIGGHNGIQDLRSVEKFDPRDNSWTFVSPMRNYRAGACAVGVYDRLGQEYVRYIHTTQIS